jgi:hypothetical protein
VSTASNGDSLFGDGDPFDDPVWQAVELMAGAPPRPADGYITCTLAWLARVLPVVCTANRLAVALLLYRRCLVQRSKTVSFPNSELSKLGISRRTKFRALALLEEAGAVTVETRNGRSVRVTLHWFPQ